MRRERGGSRSLDEYDITRDFLTDDDWHELERFRDLLAPFYDLSQELQSDGGEGMEGRGSVWQYITMLDFAHKHLYEAKNAAEAIDSRHYKAGIEVAIPKLMKYYQKAMETPIYRMAVALHPGRRFEYFDTMWDKWPQWRRDTKKDLAAYFRQYADENEQVDESLPFESTRSAARSQTSTEAFTSTSQELPMRDPRTNTERPKRSAFRAFGDPTQFEEGTHGRPKKKKMNEWDRYNFFPVSDEDAEVDNPLNWWWQRRAEYPLLSQLAINILSIPAMSAEPERVFSSAGKLITKERNRLNDDVVEADECQKHWLLSGLLNTKM